MLPSAWASLPPREKALCMAMIDRYAKAHEAQKNRIERGKT
ncbi:MAG: hypothetical protein ACI4QB_09485 [Eubacteriales bacterium]